MGNYDPNYNATPDSLSPEQEEIYEKLVAREPSELVVDNPGMMSDIIDSVIKHAYASHLMYRTPIRDFEPDETLVAELIKAGWMDGDIREAAEGWSGFCPWCDNEGFVNEYRGEHVPDAEIDCPVCNQ